MLLERGVVGLRGGHVGFEQHPAVDGQPAPVEGLHLVRHRDVGMEIRVAGPAVPVCERGRDQAPDVDLRIPCGPVRVNKACVSMNAKASSTAAR
jgi:hypothetical protein